MPSPLLTEIAHPFSLEIAWTEAKRGGRAMGLDGVTLQAFDCDSYRELPALTQELQSGDYRPWPARLVDIEKIDGETRRIGVCAVRDRVVQRSLLWSVGARVESELEDCSFAYRPNRSVERALAVMEGFRVRGWDWVVRMDVRQCFDSLDRERLMAEVGRIVPERDVIRVIEKSVQAGGVLPDGSWLTANLGIPQGAVISPMLCNLYLDSFDERMQNWGHPMVRYADDMAILARSEKEARTAYARASRALAEIALVPNESKLWIGTFAQGFTFLGAIIVGALRIPTTRIDTPGPGNEGVAPRFVFGYAPGSERRMPKRSVSRKPHDDDWDVADWVRMERHGDMPSVGAAFLDAWRDGSEVVEDPPGAYFL